MSRYDTLTGKSDQTNFVPHSQQMIESFDTNSLTSCSHALLAALVDGLEIRLWEEDVLQEIFPSPVDDQCRAAAAKVPI